VYFQVGLKKKQPSDPELLRERELGVRTVTVERSEGPGGREAGLGKQRSLTYEQSLSESDHDIVTYRAVLWPTVSLLHLECGLCTLANLKLTLNLKMPIKGGGVCCIVYVYTHVHIYIYIYI